MFFFSFCFLSFIGVTKLFYSFPLCTVVLSGGSGEKEIFVKPPT